jgi:hypothetical protein
MQIHAQNIKLKPPDVTVNSISNIWSNKIYFIGVYLLNINCNVLLF